MTTPKSYDLWGEIENAKASLKAVAAAARSTGAAPIFGAWAYPYISASRLLDAPDNKVPLFLADIRVSKNGSFVGNTAVSVIKVTYVAHGGNDSGTDNYWMGTNYGNVTIMGRDMVKNAWPTTATTNSTYALITDQDPYSIQLWTANTAVGKYKTISRISYGRYQVVLWYNDEYATVRMEARV